VNLNNRNIQSDAAETEDIKSRGGSRKIDKGALRRGVWGGAMPLTVGSGAVPPENFLKLTVAEMLF
jgi:hypothetical protein